VELVEAFFEIRKNLPTFPQFLKKDDNFVKDRSKCGQANDKLVIYAYITVLMAYPLYGFKKA